MFTPQQIEEQTFVKAVFGGYDMQSVDDFLGPLTEDYVVLYKENAVLKSKMKVLVEKLEEYRSQEDSMRKALMAAQQTADNMIAATQKKCARMLNDAQKTLEGQHTDLKQEIEGEKLRLKAARGAVQDYITKLQVELEEMKTRQMVAAEPVAKAYDFDAEPENRPQEDVAKTIEQNLERIVGEEMASPGDLPSRPRVAETPAPVKPAPKPATVKPAESKPAESKPAESKPAQAKAAEPKPFAAKPAESKPVAAKPAEAKPAEAKPAETKPVEAKSAEAKPAAPKAAPIQVAEPKPAAEESSIPSPASIPSLDDTRVMRPKGVSQDTLTKFADLQFGKNYDPKH